MAASDSRPESIPVSLSLVPSLFFVSGKVDCSLPAKRWEFSRWASLASDLVSFHTSRVADEVLMLGAPGFVLEQSKELF